MQGPSQITKSNAIVTEQHHGTNLGKLASRVAGQVKVLTISTILTHESHAIAVSVCQHPFATVEHRRCHVVRGRADLYIPARKTGRENGLTYNFLTQRTSQNDPASANIQANSLSARENVKADDIRLGVTMLPSLGDTDLNSLEQKSQNKAF